VSSAVSAALDAGLVSHYFILQFLPTIFFTLDLIPLPVGVFAQSLLFVKVLDLASFLSSASKV